MTRWVNGLRAAPVTVPCLVAVGVLAWWTAQDAGYALTTWAPGTLIVIGLLGLALVLVPDGWRDAPATVRVAVAALAAFTAWSYLSILWAGAAGDAWEGANRTLLYLALFTLSALWRQRSDTAAGLLGLWTAAVIAVALVTALRIGTGDDPAALFVDDRLAEPAGYPNAVAAGLLMALWPAVALVGCGRVHAALRGLLAAGAVLVAGLALLCLSRGSLLAVPLTAVAFFATVPGRVRHLLVVLPVAAAVVVAAPGLLALTDALGASRPPAPDVVQELARGAVRTLLLGALVVGAAVAALGFLHAARPPAPRVRAAAGRAATAFAVVVTLVVLVGGLVVAGNPVDRLDSAWTSFKGGYGDQRPGSRLVGGLGSNRYDFYRVGLDAFRGAPLRGIGVENFQQDYLARGRSDETPRYPHSVELRTLAQTGLVGTLLLLVALGAALVAASRAARGADAAGRAVAAGALGAFAYWFVHGSADWFWEFAGLGGSAFLLLGLACGLAPRRPAAWAGAPAPRARARPAGQPGGRVPARVAWPTVRSRTAVAAVGVWALVAAVSIALPWMAQRDVEVAGRIFDRRPAQAFARLDRAAALNPLSDRPALVEGSIALRFGDLAGADRAFARALARTRRGAYATLQRGAIASAQGRRAEALVLLRRARTLAPRDPLVREALAIVRSGGQIDVANLSRKILRRAEKLRRG